MSQKAYGKGSICPPKAKPDTFRLYSMRFCPYAKRVRLVLADKQIPFETININLAEKPEWYLKRFPAGQVPVLELNERTISESLIIVDYLDESQPGEKLYPTDPFKKAEEKCWISKFSKVTDLFGKSLYKRELATEAFQELLPVLDIFETELEMRKTSFFGGNKPRILDLMIWPWFEMMMMGENLLGSEFAFEEILPKARFILLRSWMKGMQEYPAVNELFNLEIQSRYADTFYAGKRDFDVGLND